MVILVRENMSRHFVWNHNDRLVSFYVAPSDGPISQQAIYLYDAGGERVKKFVRNQAGEIETTVVIAGLLEHHRQFSNNSATEKNTLHVVDDQSRIATLRVGPAFAGDATPVLKYYLGDHLGSSHVVIGGDGAWINREEYRPFGEASFGGFARKRYRFTGKERDGESGLCYHGARYYAPWLARWTSADPAGMIDGVNLYAYVRNNPMIFVDPSGTEGEQYRVGDISKADEPVSKPELDNVMETLEAKIVDNLRHELNSHRKFTSEVEKLTDVKGFDWEEFIKTEVGDNIFREYLYSKGRIGEIKNELSARGIATPKNGASQRDQDSENPYQFTLADYNRIMASKSGLGLALIGILFAGHEAQGSTPTTKQINTTLAIGQAIELYATSRGRGSGYRTADKETFTLNEGAAASSFTSSTICAFKDGPASARAIC